MIVIQVRDLINGTCGAPILAPNEFIARRQVGRVISENKLLSQYPHKCQLDIVGDWDESDGLKPIEPKHIAGDLCFAEYQAQLLDPPFSKPGEGEFIAEDPEK